MGRCQINLSGADAVPHRMGGVLHCPTCIVDFRGDMKVGLWVMAGIAVLIPLVGGLGFAGLLPFVTGGSAPALLGLVLSPIAMMGAVVFEFRVLKKGNEVADRKASEAMRELEAGD